MRTFKKTDSEQRKPVAVEQDSAQEGVEGEVISSLERWNAKVAEAMADAKEAVVLPVSDSEAGRTVDSDADLSEPEEKASDAAVDSKSSDESSVSSKTEKQGVSSASEDTSRFSLTFSTNLGVPQTGSRPKQRAPVVTSSQGTSAAAQSASGKAVTEKSGPTATPDDRASAKTKTPQPRADSRIASAGMVDSRAESSVTAGRADKPNSKGSHPQTAEEGPAQTDSRKKEASADGSLTAASAQEEAARTNLNEGAPADQSLTAVAEAADETEQALTATDEETFISPSADSTLIPAIPGVEQSVEQGGSGYRSSIVIGFLLLLFGFGGFGAWSVLAPLKSGIMASGFVKLAGERKTVQHLEGGIIREILVKEGDAVEAGQILVRLDGTRSKASLESLLAEYYTLLVKKARLESERNGLEEVRFPPVLLDTADHPKVQELIEGEKRLFSARNATIKDQLGVYDSWSEGYKREIDGLDAQRIAARKQLVHIRDELNSVEILFKKGLIDKPRLLSLKRTAAGLEGQVGSYTASIARAEQKIGESSLRSVSLITQRTEEVSSELQTIEASLLKIQEQLPALKDTVSRLEIRAPRSGRVVGLKFHTAGGVITPTSPIMDIVPEDDVLIIEAMISPTDIDIVVPGTEAQIQLTAYSTRKTPQIPGTVLQVSADRMEDPRTGEPYYQALVEIDADALGQIENVKLYPGMPASIQIVGGERTPLDYLLSPIEAGLRNTWLED